MNYLQTFILKNREIASWLLLFFLAIGVSLFYAGGPGLGDDINYWGLAMNLHEGVPQAWDPRSFHDLRWPVWGLIWLLQVPFGFSAASYYLQPAIYLGAGAVLVFYMAGQVGLSFSLRWCAGLFFILHPLLDPSISRPMPDLSEGFWLASSFAAWLALMKSKSDGNRVALAALTGLLLACAQANRITGVFSVPVLIAGTIFCYPRKFGWLLLCGVFALFFVGIEAAIYHHFTGDWLQNLHANLAAKGRKGTEPVPLWQLPFRFFKPLWRQPVDVLTTLLALFGAGFIFWRGDKPARALAIYGLVYYLAFSCALQSIFPPRPLVRDGDRFLASMAFPMSLLAPFGLVLLGRISDCSKYGSILAAYIRKHAFFAIIVLSVLLAVLSTRTPGNKQYLSQISHLLREVPAGTRVFSHDTMRFVSYLANSEKARSIHWTLAQKILTPTADDLKLLESCDRVWLVRKNAWVSSRIRSETGRQEVLPKLAPYLTPPLAGWQIESVIHKGNVPDFLFLRRGTSPSVSPMGRQILERFIGATELPHEWKLPKKTIMKSFDQMIVPENLRGKNAFLGVRYASNLTEPLRVSMKFFDKDGRCLSSVLFKPYFFPLESADFFAFHIPAEARTVSFGSKVEKRTTTLKLADFELLVQ